MSNTRYLNDIANYINKGNGAHCFGTGWEVTNISADAHVIGAVIQVTVRIKITSDWVIATDSVRRGVENEINENVNSYVREQLEDYARNNPGVLREVKPEIKVKIRID